MPAAAHPRAPDAAPPPPARVVVLGQAALLVAAWAFIFSPIWRGGWLWDDDTEVTSNLQLRTWAGLRDIWLAPTGADYFPLKSTVQWLLWQGWGNDPAGYHLASASLHLLAAFLFWRVLEKLGVRLAWLGGLLFVIHPLVIESVAWVSELKNTLSLPLVLLAYLAYLDYDARGRRGDYRRALLWFVAAMLCKTSVVMLPVVLLLFTWWKYGRLTRAGVRDSLPFFAVALILGLVTVWFQQERAIGEATLTLTSGDLPTRVARAGLAVWFYLEKCVLPVGLLPVYPPWRLEGLRAWLAWPAVAALLAWLWTQRAGWGRHALLGYGFFLLNLAPVLGLIPMSYLTIAPVADHFVYLSVLGILGLAAAGAGEIWRRLERGGRVFAATGAVVVALLLAGESRQYTAVFHDWQTLWVYVLQRNPDSWLARYDLANSLAERGLLREAAVEYQESIRLEPRLARIHNNLGIVLEHLGREDEAMVQYREAIRLRPDLVEGRNNLGNALLTTGHPDQALAQYQLAARVDPTSFEAHYNLGNVLLLFQRPGEAADAYAVAVGLAPDNPAVHLAYGNALMRLNRFAPAAVEYAAAVRLDPASVIAHHNLAAAYSRLGRGEEAMRELAEAQRLKSAAASVSASPSKLPALPAIGSDEP